MISRLGAVQGDRSPARAADSMASETAATALSTLSANSHAATVGWPSWTASLKMCRKSGNENRAHNLRQLITRTGYLARAPERGEYEALELGRRALLDPGSPATSS
jgi:hypothetical protein